MTTIVPKKRINSIDALRGFELIDGFIEKSESDPALKLQPLPDGNLSGEESPEQSSSEELSTEEGENDDS